MLRSIGIDQASPDTNMSAEPPCDMDRAKAEKIEKIDRVLEAHARVVSVGKASFRELRILLRIAVMALTIMIPLHWLLSPKGQLISIPYAGIVALVVSVWGACRSIAARRTAYPTGIADVYAVTFMMMTFLSGALLWALLTLLSH